jgi:hypothetical protein
MPTIRLWARAQLKTSPYSLYIIELASWFPLLRQVSLLKRNPGIYIPDCTAITRTRASIYSRQPQATLARANGQEIIDNAKNFTSIETNKLLT